MESVQGEPPCDVNVISTKKLTSLAPSSITTNQSCLTPTINIVEDVDNSQEFDNIEEDEGSISKPKTHAMPLTRVINRGHLV
jgi:hypothetical protein